MLVTGFGRTENDTNIKAITDFVRAEDDTIINAIDDKNQTKRSIVSTFSSNPIFHRVFNTKYAHNSMSNKFFQNSKNYNKFQVVYLRPESLPNLNDNFIEDKKTDEIVNYTTTTTPNSISTEEDAIRVTIKEQNKNYEQKNIHVTTTPIQVVTSTENRFNGKL